MDYCTMALQSVLEDQKVQQMMELKNLVEESNFIYECVSTGYIDLENLNYAPVNEGFGDALVEFISKIIAHFKAKAVARSKKYIPWLKECGDEIKARASKIEPVKLSPLWEGKWNEDGEKIPTLLNTAYNNYSNKKYKEYNYTQRFLSKSSILTDDGTTELSDALKYYFRYGSKGSGTKDEVTVNGAMMASLIGDMITYMIEFDDKALGHMVNIDKANSDILEKLKEPDGTKAVDNNKPDSTGSEEKNPSSNDSSSDTVPSKEESASESIDANHWLSVEERPVSESLLTTLVNYTAVFEDDKDINVKKPSGDITVKDDNNGSATTDDSEAKAYRRNVEVFAKFVVASYQTVLDERFILYLNICKDIGDASGKGPRFDRNGNYISKKTETSDIDTTKVNKDAGGSGTRKKS